MVTQTTNATLKDSIVKPHFGAQQAAAPSTLEIFQLISIQIRTAKLISSAGLVSVSTPAMSTHAQFDDSLLCERFLISGGLVFANGRLRATI